MLSKGSFDHRRTGPFPFGEGWGGGTKFFARISHLCPKSRICWAMHFCLTRGGGWGGEVEESSSFGVIEYGDTTEGEGVGGGPLPQ